METLRYARVRRSLLIYNRSLLICKRSLLISIADSCYAYLRGTLAREKNELDVLKQRLAQAEASMSRVFCI